MPENGPGGREVGRVSLRVLPDTSKFLPSLKKYAERVERTVAIRLNTSVDSRGLEADVARISQTVERSVPAIKVPASPVSDGFARDLQTQVRAASKAIEANIPLTADGERFRRSISAEVAKLEADIATLDLEVPLSVEDASRARRELKARVEGLQALALLNPVEIPVTAGGGALASGGSLSSYTGIIAGLAAAAALVTGGVIAALPAILASIAGPVAAIALGFEGISRAAEYAKPAFEVMRGALSSTFAEGLAPAFAALADLMPKITPGLQAIATALSGQFTAFITALSTPENVERIQGILDGIARIIETMTPAIGPFVDALLLITEDGITAFVEAAPALADAITTMSGVFQYLSETGVIEDAAKGFATLVIGVTAVIGAISAVLVFVSSFIGKIAELATSAGRIAGQVVAHFQGMRAGIGGAIAGAVETIRTLPARVVGALSGLGGLLFASGAELIAGFVRGIYSMIGQVVTAAGYIARLIALFFPGSPVKEGPLKSWNDGGAGKRLGDMLATGLDSSKDTVRAASRGLAGAVAVPALAGAAVPVAASGSAGNRFDSAVLADELGEALRKAPLVVDTRDNARAVARRSNSRGVLA